MFFSMRITKEWLDHVKEFASKKGLTVSALIRVAVDYYMRREG